VSGQGDRQPAWPYYLLLIGVGGGAAAGRALGAAPGVKEAVGRLGGRFLGALLQSGDYLSLIGGLAGLALALGIIWWRLRAGKG